MRVRNLTRLVLTGAVTAVTVGLLAGLASAHVEVSADKAQAGATDVTLSFVAESESTTAGIVALRVVLPAGIAPAQVSYLSGPTGWTLTTAVDGYTVAGPAVPAGEDATYRVKIAQLPADTTSLPFKTLQTYSDGRIDRWIEIPTTGNPKPENPAPVLTLAAAPAPASTSGAPAPTQTVGTDLTTAPASPAAADRGRQSTNPWTWAAIWIAVLVVLATAATFWWQSRRRRRPAGDSR